MTSQCSFPSCRSATLPSFVFVLTLILAAGGGRAQAAPDGDHLIYSVLSTINRVRPPFVTVEIRYGPSVSFGKDGLNGQWWEMVLRADTNGASPPLVLVRALTSADPLAERREPLRFKRYQLRVPETGETLEFRDRHSGEALLPAWNDFVRSFIPAAVPASLRQGGAPQTCEYLGQVLSLRDQRSGEAWDEWKEVRILNLDREVLVGTGRSFKDAEGHRLPQKPERRDYTYVRFQASDYPIMMEAGMNLFTVEPAQEKWVRAEPVFYLRSAGGNPKLRYPADLYRANYLGPVMFMDEPAILLADDPTIRGTLRSFSDAAVLLEKRTRLTYGSSGSYGAYHLEKALLDEGLNLGDLRVVEPDYPVWETFYDRAFYEMKGGGMGVVHEGRYQQREFEAAVQRMTGEEWTVSPQELLRYHYAFLRGAARPFHKFWGTAIYGQCDTNLAPAALTLAYDMGARYFWFWTSDHEHHVPWPEQLALARALKHHVQMHPRPSIFGPPPERDAVICAPNGCFLSLDDLSWMQSFGEKSGHSVAPAYRTLMRQALTEVRRCFDQGEDYDITVDDGHPITGYKRIVRLQGAVP